MGKLIYAINMSLDGFMEDAEGTLNWSIPDDDVFDFWTESQEQAQLELYGRRMYESMIYWETVEAGADGDDEAARMYRFAQAWRNTDKIVYSTTLDEVISQRTELRREFNADEVRQFKADTKSNISISGANLAGQAMALGVLDECHVMVFPILLGSGKPALPQIPYHRLEFISAQSFDSGLVYMKYRVVY